MNEHEKSMRRNKGVYFLGNFNKENEYHNDIRKLSNYDYIPTMGKGKLNNSLI